LGTKKSQEIRFFRKIGFLKVRKKSDFWEKSDFSRRAKSQEIRFFGKIGFLKKSQEPRNPISGRNRISQEEPRAKKSDFLEK
jgi:hypothetical protein